ncbi:MAG TPA: sensor domain-containing protein [Steroidobacteraceae bacterium]|nr:sensor domain-containing protein [Steroidobacteraceae bacterium]
MASAYRDTEAKVKAALATPRKIPSSGAGAFFGVFLDPRAYTSLFFMLLSLATGVIYFTFAVTGLSLSAGLAVLVIGVPFFLMFIALSRVVSLAEGRLIEAMTGERMPRRPVHQSNASGFWARVGEMLKDRRTWTTFAYLILMLPLGIVYFIIAVVGLSVSLACIFAPLVDIAGRYGWFELGGVHMNPVWLESPWVQPFMVLAGVLLLTVLMHLARSIGRLHAMYAKVLLVSPAAPLQTGG